MTFDVSSQILWEVLNQILFINTARLQPLVLVITSDPFSQVRWKHPVMHPLLRVTLLHPHLLETDRKRLEISLHVTNEESKEKKPSNSKCYGEYDLSRVRACLKPLTESAACIRETSNKVTNENKERDIVIIKHRRYVT